MSAFRDIDFDLQSPLQFHRYVNLPSELRIIVIQEFIAILRKEIRSDMEVRRGLPFGKFAIFAAVHSEWQHEFEAEEELFGTLALSTNDLPTFHQVLNQRRRNLLSEVTLRVLVNNTAVDFDGRTDNDSSGNAAVLSRTRRFIVDSVAEILESVENAINAGSQATKSDLALHTQFIIPRDRDHRRLRKALLLDDGIDCDFSQLRPAHSFRRFSQRRWFDVDRWEALGRPRGLVVSPSARLTLASRMPSLEEADIAIPSRASVRGINSLPPNACPRLKTVRIPTSSQHTGWNNLALWASCWGNKIENFDLMTDNVPAFIRLFFQREKHSEAIGWHNIQVFNVHGICDARFESTPRDVWMASDGPYKTLSAMAMTLERLPSIRDMTFNLHVPLGPGLGGGYFSLGIEMHIGSGSRNLTISGPSEHEERRAFSHAVQSGSSVSGDLSFKDSMQLAAAEVQAAVRTHRGHDLEIVVRQD